MCLLGPPPFGLTPIGLPPIGLTPLELGLPPFGLKGRPRLPKRMNFWGKSFGGYVDFCVFLYNLTIQYILNIKGNLQYNFLNWK